MLLAGPQARLSTLRKGTGLRREPSGEMDAGRMPIPGLAQRIKRWRLWERTALVAATHEACRLSLGQAASLERIRKIRMAEESFRGVHDREPSLTSRVYVYIGISSGGCGGC